MFSAISKKRFEIMLKRRRVFPFIYRWENPPPIEELWQNAQKDNNYHFFLDSVKQGLNSRWSYFSLSEPETIFTSRGKDIEITSKNAPIERFISPSPIDEIKKLTRKYHFVDYEGCPPFSGGAVGYFSYDFGRHFEKIPSLAKDDTRLPESCFMFFNDFLAYDMKANAAFIVMLAGRGMNRKNYSDILDKINSYVSVLSAETGYVITSQNTPVCHSEGACDRRISPVINKARSFPPTMAFGGQDDVMVQSDFTRKSFENAVMLSKRYIANGDIFQVNLAQRFKTDFRGDPVHLYMKLRALNPSPYAGYIHTPKFNLLSCSPELLVRKHGSLVETRPIAGTRGRNNYSDDKKISSELLLDPKERAEHIMLVDLERNDLGRVCRPKSIRVNESMVVEKYSHVLHIVSNVKGKLKAGKDVFDVLRAMFPGGTITGCPKVRSMEIIDELEPVRRGPYCGSAGWIGYNGDAELNILIRTILLEPAGRKQRYRAYFSAGAGIVADSDPSREYDETLHKAKALIEALS